jgi:hypothetical protein
MSLLRSVRRIVANLCGPRVRRPAPPQRLQVEALEERAQPSALPVIRPHDPFLFKPVGPFTPLALHIHPHLKIVVDGHPIRIPAGIGLEANGNLPIHTHDATGKIHIESPKKATFLLADFFSVWGKTFNSKQILNFHADAHHRITMTVDGKPSTAFGSLVLHDGEQIVIQYGPLTGQHAAAGRIR